MGKKIWKNYFCKKKCFSNFLTECNKNCPNEFLNFFVRFRKPCLEPVLLAVWTVANSVVVADDDNVTAEDFIKYFDDVGADNRDTTELLDNAETQRNYVRHCWNTTQLRQTLLKHNEITSDIAETQRHYVSLIMLKHNVNKSNNAETQNVIMSDKGKTQNVITSDKGKIQNVIKSDKGKTQNVITSDKGKT